MPAPPSEAGLPPRCETCGLGTAQIGKLPRIGLRPLVYVYKCDACNQITSIEPERQDSPTISPTATPPMPNSGIKKAPHRISRRHSRSDARVTAPAEGWRLQSASFQFGKRRDCGWTGFHPGECRM